MTTGRSWDFHFGDGVNGLLAHGPVDHTIVDVPYSKDVEEGHANIEVRDNSFGFEAMTEDLRNRMARAIAQQTRRWALVFCSLEETHLWRFGLEAAGMSYYRTGLWVRQNTAPQFNGMGPAQACEAIVIAHSRVLPQRWNGGGKPAIWYGPIVRTDRVHETQKPGRLLSELIMDFTDEGELVADLCAGSATTGVAAVGLGRRFVGWETNEKHYLNGLHRLELPLIERREATAEQIELIENPHPTRPKGSAARARMELERTILDEIGARGSEGIRTSELLVLGTEREIRDALQRLRKREVIRREGKTIQTRWLANHKTDKNNGPNDKEDHSRTCCIAQPSSIDEPGSQPGPIPSPA